MEIIKNIKHNSNFVDIAGKQFHNLTVLNYAGYLLGKNNKHTNLWHCECSCGQKRQIITHNLISGKAKSCGCRRKRLRENNPRFKGKYDISKKVWYSIEKGAKRRSIPFSISIDDGWAIYLKQNKLCPYTGEKLVFPTSYDKHDGNLSLDRINSSKGYTKDNIQWVLKWVNLAKHTLSHTQFLEMIKKIYLNNF